MPVLWSTDTRHCAHLYRVVEYWTGLHGKRFIHWAVSDAWQHFLLGLMDTDLFGISPIWPSLASVSSIPTRCPPFYLSWIGISGLTSRWQMLGFLSGSLRVEPFSLFAVTVSCFRHCSLALLISSVYWASRMPLTWFHRSCQRAAWDCLALWLIQYLLMPADASLFCLEMIETIVGEIPESPPQADISPYSNDITQDHSFMPLKASIISAMKTLSQLLFPEC